MAPVKTSLASLLSIAALAGCGAPESSPARERAVTVWAKAKKRVPVVREAPPALGAPFVMQPYGEDDWYFVRLPLSPCAHGYRVTYDAGTHADPYNPLTTHCYGAESSLVTVPDCALPEAWVDAPDGALERFPVSRRVNDVRNDDPGCIAPPEDVADGPPAPKKDPPAEPPPKKEKIAKTTAQLGLFDVAPAVGGGKRGRRG